MYILFIYLFLYQWKEINKKIRKQKRIDVIKESSSNSNYK
jgi:hypothetical protein